MIREERDPTDLGLSPLPPEQGGEPVDDAPSVPASPEHRARLIERVAKERGWSRRSRPSRRCTRPSCLAEPNQWCRRGRSRPFGHVHDGR